MNQTGEAVHHKAITVCWLDIERDGPPRPIHIAGPIVVRDDDFAVLGVFAGSHKRTAMVGRCNRWERSDLVILIVLRDVVAPFFRGIHYHNVPHIEFHATSI